MLQVVTSSDHLVGEALTLSPKVDLISFTGSTAVGKRIMEKGAPTLKRVFLELGGKSATIVLDDADFATSVPSGIAVCFHAGQGCAIQTRMLLPRSRYEEGVEILKSTLGSVAYGDPQRPDVLMGPVISSKQRDRVLRYIEKGVAEGATLALGGGRPAAHPTGWFVEPTLFTDVDNAMTIAQEEIFGPVLVTIPYEDDDDAVRIANDSVYGLSGGVFSGSLERGAARGGADPHRELRRQRRHADRAGRHALRRLQAQRDRPPERPGRVRPVSRGQVGGLAGAPVGAAPGAWLTTHPSCASTATTRSGSRGSSPRPTTPAPSSSTCRRRWARPSVTGPVSSAPSVSASATRSTCARTPCRAHPRPMPS